MVDIVVEIIRVFLLTIILIFLAHMGRRHRAIAQPGWRILLAGFGLLMFGCLLDVTDNFESLNRFVVIGDTEVQSILEKLVGFLGGFVLLAIGLWRWLPRLTSINALEEAANNLADANVKLEQLASTDKLTDLPNRAVFHDRLDHIMQLSRRDNRKFAVLFFDFDRFKVVNDSLGHSVGDALLCDIADIFRDKLRESDMVARFGGDEFVVLLEDLTDWTDAEIKANQLLEAFALPHQLGGHEVVSTASIGLVTSEFSYQASVDVIRDADAALYQAKAKGKAQVVIFDQQMHANAIERLTLETDLRNAIAREELQLLYQPIVELESGHLTGFEALIRWEHPQRGTISPLDFIPIAEETGLIVDIGNWTLKTVAAHVEDWKQRFALDYHLKINVNVSKRQLLNPSFVSDIVEYKEKHNLRPSDIQLEITETIIADDRANVINLLTQLRKGGFPIVMDDFGTGVSSLSALHNYPIDVLKIDREFVRGLENDRSLLAVMAAITNLAENLGIKTVAEGIESTDIVGALQLIGCTWGQGYYFAKPMPLSETEAYLRNAYKISSPHAA